LERGLVLAKQVPPQLSYMPTAGCSIDAKPFAVVCKLQKLTLRFSGVPL
jgi:hypothetical protein